MTWRHRHRHQWEPTGVDLLNDVSFGLPGEPYTLILTACHCGLRRTVRLDGHWTLDQLRRQPMPARRPAHVPSVGNPPIDHPNRTGRWLIDAGERVAWTFAEASAGALIAAGAFDANTGKAATIAGLTAAAGLVKVTAARWLGRQDSAAILPASVDH